MSGTHPEISAELRALAQALLDRLDPALRRAAVRATSGGAGTCEQVWCPVCALAALISGEQHPLLTVVAEHSVALLAVIRAMTDTQGRPAGPDPQPPPPPPSPEAPAPPGPGRYQHIPVSIDDQSPR